MRMFLVQRGWRRAGAAAVRACAGGHHPELVRRAHRAAKGGALQQQVSAPRETRRHTETPHTQGGWDTQRRPHQRRPHQGGWEAVVLPVLVELDRHHPERNWAIKGSNSRFRNRHWQSPGGTTNKLPNSPGPHSLSHSPRDSIPSRGADDAGDGAGSAARSPSSSSTRRTWRSWTWVTTSSSTYNSTGVSIGSLSSTGISIGSLKFNRDFNRGP